MTDFSTRLDDLLRTEYEKSCARREKRAALDKIQHELLDAQREERHASQAVADHINAKRESLHLHE